MSRRTGTTSSPQINDPDYLARPMTGSAHMDYRPDLKIGGIECDRDLAERFLRELR